MAFNSLSTKIFKLLCTYLYRETNERERRGREKFIKVSSPRGRGKNQSERERERERERESDRETEREREEELREILDENTAYYYARVLGNKDQLQVTKQEIINK